MNEKGFFVGLYYFLNYGRYFVYDVVQRDKSFVDFQLVLYVLVECSMVDEVKEVFLQVCVINIDFCLFMVYWCFIEVFGRQVVLEIVNEMMNFYDNLLGVLINLLGFEWYWINLNNYINL